MKPGQVYIALKDNPACIPMYKGGKVLVTEACGDSADVFYCDIISGDVDTTDLKGWQISSHDVELGGFALDKPIVHSLKFKKLKDTAVLPSRGKPDDIGLDVTLISREWDPVTGCFVYGTGLAVELPPGHAGFLLPRSSAYKKRMTLSNCVGLVDPNYRGEIKAMLRPLNADLLDIYQVGERALQLVVIPVPRFEPEWAEELSSTDRGDQGFGSSGQ